MKKPINKITGQNVADATLTRNNANKGAGILARAQYIQGLAHGLALTLREFSTL